MLGPIGSNLMSILKVMSPAELERYAGESAVRNVSFAQAAGAETETSPETQYDHYNKKEPKNNKGNSSSQEDEDHKAKVIPIRKDIEEDDHLEKADQQQIINSEKVEDPHLASHDEPKINKSRIDGKDSLEEIGILSSSKMRQLEQEERERKSKQKESSSVFIINQRKNLNRSKEKLKGQFGLRAYKDISAIEFAKHTEISDKDIDELEEDYKFKGSIGVLLDKKLG